MALVPFTGELDAPEKKSAQFVPFTGKLDEPEDEGTKFVPFTGKLDSAPIEPAQAEAAPVDDLSGFFTGTPLAPAEPAAPTPARVRTERDQEFAPGEELVTGVKAGAKGLANLPAIFALQKDADVAALRQRELDAFALIDAGETITPAEAARMGLDYARIRNYQYKLFGGETSPEHRQEYKAFNQQAQNLPIPIRALPTVAISQLDIQKMGQGSGTSVLP